MKVLIGVDPHKASVAVAAVDEATGELLDKIAWVRGGLITFNTNLSRILARSHTSLLVISTQPDTEGGMQTPVQSQSR
jgi:hypothetical protein